MIKHSLRATVFCLSLFASFAVKAQDLTGIWKGYFISDAGEYYKLEFQIAQNGSAFINGVSYSYLDVRFYGKATMTGSFLPSSSTFKIRELKTVEVKNMLGGATCIMNYTFTYSKSSNEEFLDGDYLGKYEPPYEANPPGKWGDCGGGTVHLRKVTQSDFHVEPFLKNRLKDLPVIDNQPPPRKTVTEENKTKTVIINKPPVKKTETPVTPGKTVEKNKVVINKTPEKSKIVIINKPPVKKTENSTTNNNSPEKTRIKEIDKPVRVPNTNKQMIDSVKKTAVINKPKFPVPEQLAKRTNELVKTIVINDPDVTVKLYDNGEIDGDSVSVYFDQKNVLSRKGLTAEPLILHLHIEDADVHELVMVAENLGSIPPNTSLMVVEAGEQRFDVQISTTEQQNAVIRFRYNRN
jgi:hypothetical protein